MVLNFFLSLEAPPLNTILRDRALKCHIEQIQLTTYYAALSKYLGKAITANLIKYALHNIQ